ncbi:MAG: tryptophan--tRNA ligase [Clostridia bacterium]|nr:tryptophan--tRNA ligase [Clostridia bacterium]
MNKDGKKVIFSGIKPSGDLHIGHFIGALKNWKALQDEYECYYSVVDMHAITVRQDPAQLRKRSLSMIAQYVACGLDPQKNTFFIQSHVPTHAELGWVLDCYTMFGELSRMTQFKDKSAKHADNINAGLFTYPTLMAADILLYQTDLVPVGEDQTQHIEIARDIANRFNGIYGETFTMPQAYTPKVGARIKSLQNPAEKMSKSDENANACVLILDDPDTIMRKFRRAVTDSGSEVRRGEGKDGINNLITIYSAITGLTPEQVEAEFEGKGYGDFKTAVGEQVCSAMRPVQEEYRRLMASKDFLQAIYKEGAQRALSASSRTLRKVYRKVGFVDR